MSGKKWHTTPRDSTVSKNRLAWTNSEGLTVSIYEYPEGDERKPTQEVGTDIVMYWTQGGRDFRVNLSNMTSDELDAVHVIVEEAFSRARETVYQRDEVAREIFNTTGEPFTRLYRRTPVLVHRTGTFRKYSKSVFNRLEGIRRLVITPDRAGHVQSSLPTFPAAPLAREIRAEVVERIPKELESADNPKTFGEHQGIRQVLRNPEPPGVLQTPGADQDDPASDSGGDIGSDEDAGFLPDTGGASAARSVWIGGVPDI